MSIMDMFKTKPEADASNAATETAKASADAAAKATVDAAAAKAAQADPNNPAKSAENPLDVYGKLFNNAATNSEIQAPSFNIDPAVIADVSSKMDFTKGINPELMTKATSGDAAAMIQLIQETGRNAYRASLEHATKLTDTHLGQRSEYESKKLNQGVKEHLTSQALSSGSDTNINLNHPVIRAELNAKAKLIAASPEYADASPEQIAKAAKQMIVDIYSAMNPADPTKTKEGKAKPAEVDYMKYLGLDS